MKTVIKFIDNKEVSRKGGYATEESANNAAGSWLRDCTVDRLERQHRTVKIIND